jgi:hypothetical protein
VQRCCLGHQPCCSRATTLPTWTAVCRRFAEIITCKDVVAASGQAGLCDGMGRLQIERHQNAKVHNTLAGWKRKSQNANTADGPGLERPLPTRACQIPFAETESKSKQTTRMAFWRLTDRDKHSVLGCSGPCALQLQLAIWMCPPPIIHIHIKTVGLLVTALKTPGSRQHPCRSTVDDHPAGVPLPSRQARLEFHESAPRRETTSSQSTEPCMRR